MNLLSSAGGSIFAHKTKIMNETTADSKSNTETHEVDLARQDKKKLF